MTFVDSSVRCRRSAVFLLRFHALILETIEGVSVILLQYDYELLSLIKPQLFEQVFL